MTDLISRAAAKAAIPRGDHSRQEILEVLDRVPAVDKESPRPPGHWEVVRDNVYTGTCEIKCSQCGEMAQAYTCMGKPCLYGYCPNCGARMERLQ